jgi:hypothetical protein
MAADDLTRFVDRLQGHPQYAAVQRLDEELAFNASDAVRPGPPPGVGRAANYTFDLPPGAQRLTVDVAVGFDAAPAPAPLPAGLPQGNVTATIAGPGTPATVFAFSATGAQTLDVPSPSPGTWSVAVQALGQGRVHVTATSVEPVPG